MHKLKKCSKCEGYTLKEICSECKEKTKDAHYKFVKLRDVKENTEAHFACKQPK